MGFLDSLRKLFGGGGDVPREADIYRVYVRCRRCGEPLMGRIDLRNELSLADDGETWIVRKGLIGSGARRCFQTVEVTLRLDRQKQNVIESDVAGGELMTKEEYEALLRNA